MAYAKHDNTNHKRNWAENESLIAEGILSLLRKGRSAEQLRNMEIIRETGIDRDVAQSHLKDGEFFRRNIHGVAENFKNRVGDTAGTRFATVFLSCVHVHRIWFEIEFCRQSHRLFSEVMAALEPCITAGWSGHAAVKKLFLYRLLSQELFTMLAQWSLNSFDEAQTSALETKLIKLLAAFSTGQINTIMASVLY